MNGDTAVKRQISVGSLNLYLDAMTKYINFSDNIVITSFYRLIPRDDQLNGTPNHKYRTSTFSPSIGKRERKTD